MALREVPNGEPTEAAPPPHLRSEESRSLYKLWQSSTTTILQHIDASETAVKEEFHAAMKVLRAGLELELDSRFGPKSTRPPPIPAPRAELPSTTSLFQEAKAAANVKLAELAKKTHGPNIDAPPGMVGKVLDEVLDDLLRKRAEADRVKSELARLAEIDRTTEDRKKYQRKVALAMLLAFFTAIATGAGAWTWGKTEGHLEEARTHTVAPK